MSDESLDEELSTVKNLPTVNKLSVDKNQITLSGVAHGIGDVGLFRMKKRRTNQQHTYSLTWSNEQWTVSFSVDKNEIGQGVWDFYLYDATSQIDYRIKTGDEDELCVTGGGFYNQFGTTLRFRLYRTIKKSLSLAVDSASIILEQLTVSKKKARKWDVKIEGIVQDSLIQTMLEKCQINVLFTLRHTLKQIEIPAQTSIQNNLPKVKFNLNYKKLINFDDVDNSTWDCYLLLRGESTEYSFRIHIDNENKDVDYSLIEQHSLTEFKAHYIYQVYFYKTINQNLSVKLHRARAKQSIENYTIQSDTLHLQGYGFLDVHNLQSNEPIERSIIIRKRNSNEQIIIDIPEEQGGVEKQSNSYNIQVPLKKIVELEVTEKEIFDIAMQYRQQDAVYEKKLGFEQYKYIRDGVLGSIFMKNKNHYSRLYLTQTPGGNLKIETFYLTRLSYFYLKFGQGMDRKLNQSKETWLIGERANTAQDTGYHFFKYCREHHPELDVYYVVNSGSRDIKNIESLGNVLYTGTFKHVRKASIANVFIGSHDLDNILPLKGPELDNYVHGKRIFIQHGVLGRKNVEYHKKFYRDPFQLFCVSSIPEKKLVEKKMGYDTSEVKVTGLSRFDALLGKREERRSILLMPTWRDWLGRIENFRKSRYYERYTSLLTNDTLHMLLEKHDLTLDFYPHYRMQPFIEEFKTLKSDRVNIIEQGEKTVQQLLMENKLMITDYSSVSFDFNYMSKPIVFYHFDATAFFKNGILRPRSETFLGDRCKQENEVIESIKYYIEHNFKEREEIVNKKHQVFSYIDRNNNQRIFHEIKKLQDESNY